MKVAARMSGPQHFPKAHDVREGKLALEEDEQPTEAEVEVASVVIVQISCQVRVHEGDDGVKLRREGEDCCDILSLLRAYNDINVFISHLACPFADLLVLRLFSLFVLPYSSEKLPST